MSVYPAPSPSPSSDPSSTTAAPLAITGPLSIGDLLDRTFRILRARFGVLMLTAVVIMVPIAIISGLLTGGFMTSYFQFIQQMMVLDQSTPPDALLGDMLGFFGGFFGALLLVGLLYWAGNGIVSLATVFHVSQYLHGQITTTREGLQAARRRFWAYLGLTLLQGLILAGVMLVVGIVGFILLFIFTAIFGVAAGGLGSAFDNGAAGVAAVIVGMLAFFIGLLIFFVLIYGPLIYFVTRWVVSIPSLLLETLGPSDALRRSWGLTGQRFWRALGLLVLLFVLYAFVLSAPVSVMQQIALIMMPDLFGIIYTVSLVLSFLLAALWQPIYMTTITLLYYDLRVRQEAYDVTLRVTQLEQQLADQLGETPGNETLPV